MQRNSHPIGLRAWKKKVRILLSSLISSVQKQKLNVPNFTLIFRHPQHLNPFHKWRRICRYGLIGLMTLLLVVVGYHPPALTQAGGSFACDRRLYVSEGQPNSNLRRVITNPAFDIPLIGTANVEYNAIGFNIQDSFIYGMAPQSTGPNAPTVYRIDSSGSATALGSPTGFPVIPTGVDNGFVRFAFAGDVNRDGVYYVYITSLDPNFNYVAAPADRPNLYAINLTTNTVVGQWTLAGTSFADIAFNPRDDQLYAFDTLRRQMVRIDLPAGTVTYFGAISAGNSVIGGSFFNSFGDFFAFDDSGNILVTRDVANPNNPNQGVFETVGQVSAVNRFDGASCAFAPEMQKTVDPSTIVAGGTVTYRYRISNANSSPLSNLTFTDIMPDGRRYVAGTLTNPFGGTPNAFGGTQTLTITGLTIPARTVGEITVQVQIPLTATPGTIFNQARLSPVPFNPDDPNGPALPSDFPPTGLNPDQTPVQVTAAPPTPIIGLAKRVASSVNLGGGVFQVTYQLVISNLGNVDLNNIQVVEDLTNTFAQATSFTVPANSVSSPSGDLTPNPNYSGRADNPNLLAGTDTLTVGQSKTIQFVVNVTPGANLGPYNNQAVARGTAPNGQTVEDPSQNGTNSDPDGDGNPGNNNIPTPLSFAENPVLGVAKSVASIVDVGNGNFNVTYTIRAQNLGDVPLSNLQLTENLANTFGTTPFTLPANPISSPNGDLTPNPNYNGRTNLNLLAGTDTLAVGQTKILQLVVTITPPNERRNFTNQVEGTATSPTGQSVRDLSTAGINPDPNGDGNPIEQETTTLPIGPNLRLVKRITNITRGGVPVSGVDFTRFTPDPGDDDDDVGGWSNLSGGVLSGIYRLGTDNPLQTGDEVEYTVYYLSDGTQPVTDVKICDPIPENTTFIPDSFQLGQGILLNQQATNTSLTNASDTDRGTFFARLTPVTSPCPNTNNSNGSVLVDVGTLATSTPNNVGFIRFRVKID